MSDDVVSPYRRARLAYQARIGRLVTIGEVADALGVTRQTVSDWEHGTYQPKIRQLIRLADLYGVDLDTLVRGAADQRSGA